MILVDLFESMFAFGLSVSTESLSGGFKCEKFED